MDLNDAIAELRRAREEWPTGAIHNVLTAKTLEPICLAVLSGQLIPLEACNARVAAMVEAAAAECVPVGVDGGSDNDYRAGYRHAKWECNAAISRLATADATAALDAMISRAREVKPLVFEPVPSEDALCHDHWSAPALGGAYHMAPDEDSPGTWLLQWTIRADDFCMKYGGAITRHSSPEDVHSAAQADYTARIHATLRANAMDASEGER